jgi:mercuric ion transport protein
LNSRVPPHDVSRTEAGGPGRARQLGAAGAAVSGAGAALVATAATACCAGPVVAPLIVAVLGASGAAWAAGLKPYSPWLLGGSFLLLAYGFWSVYRVPKTCDAPAAAARRWSGTAVKSVLWIAAILWLAGVAANLFLGP